MSPLANHSITKNFFEESYQLNDMRGAPLTNVYWSYTSTRPNVVGTLYLIHGYGGSPIEPCLKLPMQHGLAAGFDVVALEGIDLSATSGYSKEISNMTLERQKKALRRGLTFCKHIPNLQHNNNVAIVHSLSCRALADLMVDSTFVRDYFKEVILNNPYFLMPQKVRELKSRIMRADPSGRRWEQLVNRVSSSSRSIENQTFSVPTCLNNLSVPLPGPWRLDADDLRELAKKMSYFVDKVRMHFVLGTADTMADYNLNLTLFSGLRVPNKDLVCIEGADHSFENSLSEYSRSVGNILDSIKRARQK